MPHVWRGPAEDKGTLGGMLPTKVQLLGSRPLPSPKGKEPKGSVKDRMVLPSALEGRNKLMFILIMILPSLLVQLS